MLALLALSTALASPVEDFITELPAPPVIIAGCHSGETFKPLMDRAMQTPLASAASGAVQWLKTDSILDLDAPIYVSISREQESVVSFRFGVADPARFETLLQDNSGGAPVMQTGPTAWMWEDLEAQRTVSIQLDGNTANAMITEPGKPLAEPVQASADRKFYGLLPRINDEGCWLAMDMTSFPDTPGEFRPLAMVIQGTADDIELSIKLDQLEDPARQVLTGTAPRYAPIGMADTSGFIAMRLNAHPLQLPGLLNILPPDDKMTKPLTEMRTFMDALADKDVVLGAGAEIWIREKGKKPPMTIVVPLDSPTKAKKALKRLKGILKKEGMDISKDSGMLFLGEDRSGAQWIGATSHHLVIGEAKEDVLAVTQGVGEPWISPESVEIASQPGFFVQAQVPEPFGTGPDDMVWITSQLVDADVLVAHIHGDDLTKRLGEAFLAFGQNLGNTFKNVGDSLEQSPE